MKGEKSIQGDSSDVLRVLAEHLPIQLPTRYGENMCFTKYHVLEDRSSIIELSGGVRTLRSVPSSLVEWAIIIVVYPSSRMKRQ